MSFTGVLAILLAILLTILLNIFLLQVCRAITHFQKLGNAKGVSAGQNGADEKDGSDGNDGCGDQE